MENITFEKLLLKTAFCCMASDGHIDSREVEMIKTLCDNSLLLKEIDVEAEINTLVNKINNEGADFIRDYLNSIENIVLTEQEELNIIDFAIYTIQADDEIRYAEIKFFKNIRRKLKVSDNRILENHPGIEEYLEPDVLIESPLNNFTTKLSEFTDLPQFDKINL